MEIILQILLLLSTVIGLSAYIPLLRLVIKNKIKPSFCTWSLWTLLNIIVLIGLIKTGSPYSIAIVYTIGTLLIALLVLFKKQFNWNSGDSLILVLIIISSFVLLFGNSALATIVGSIASFIAGIPDLKKSFRNPKNVPRLTALLFITANVLVIITTKDLKFVNIIYPISWISYWLINFILSLRKIKKPIFTTDF